MSLTLRIVLSVAVFVYFVIIFYFLKKKAISLKYTLLWLFGGFCMVILVIFPNILAYARKIVGIETGMNLLYIIVIGFMLILLMALTSIVSGQTEKIKKLTQNIAILEKRIRELENDKERT